MSFGSHFVKKQILKQSISKKKNENDRENSRLTEKQQYGSVLFWEREKFERVRDGGDIYKIFVLAILCYYFLLHFFHQCLLVVVNDQTAKSVFALIVINYYIVKLNSVSVVSK